MSDVSEWLETNSETLRKIAASSGLDDRLVHLIAVLVLADLADDQIDAQLVGHGFSSGCGAAESAKVARAVKEIRIARAEARTEVLATR